MGGPDAEREVSLMSGAQVAHALEASGAFEVVPQTIMRIGAEEILALRPDVVFPVLHGPWGEGGPLQEILESVERAHGIGFVGPRSAPAATAMNKIATKAIASSVGVRTPRARQLVRGEPLDLAAPLVLKPSNDGSSVDLRICRTDDEASAARAELERHRDLLMAEEYISGREMTVGIVHGEVLPIIEIIPKSAFYDYQAKYFADDTRYYIPCGLAPDREEALQRAAVGAFRAIGAQGWGRADFMLGADGVPLLLEVNTVPGMTGHSLVPMAARAVGISYEDLCVKILEGAHVG